MTKGSRINSAESTPYMQKHVRELAPCGWALGVGEWIGVDLGCGNGRNTEYLKSAGYRNVYACDLHTDYGHQLDISRDTIPVDDGTAHVILLNYVMMFVSQNHRPYVISEIDRIAAMNCSIVVELYAAKTSFTPTSELTHVLGTWIQVVLAARGWKKVTGGPLRFIWQKRGEM